MYTCIFCDKSNFPLVLQSESCEEINQENLDRAVSFYFDEQNETSVTELDSSFEKVLNALQFQEVTLTLGPKMNDYKFG